MTFGYLGYLWAMFGCCTLSVVFGGSAAFLYRLGRQREREPGAPTVSVESILTPDDPRPPDDAA